MFLYTNILLYLNIYIVSHTRTTTKVPSTLSAIKKMVTDTNMKNGMYFSPSFAVPFIMVAIIIAE